MNIKEYAGINLDINDIFLSKSKNLEYKVETIDYPKELVIFSKRNGAKTNLSFSFIKEQIDNNNWIKTS